MNLGDNHLIFLILLFCFPTQHRLETSKFTVLHICSHLSSWHTGAADQWVTGLGPLEERIFSAILELTRALHSANPGPTCPQGT